MPLFRRDPGIRPPAQQFHTRPSRQQARAFVARRPAEQPASPSVARSAMLFRWFETRIEAFPDEAPVRPPDTLLAFYIHFVRPIWPVFTILLVAGFAGALI